MKRRDFIIGATSSASLLLVDPARAARPCPPILDGGSASAACVSGGAEADWQSRISGPGVVWYHDFRSDAEVDAFRWAGKKGNDPKDVRKPNTIRRITTDGITGACLEMHRPAGSTDGAVWWRPFNPLDTGSGKPVRDPAANGTLLVLAWTPTDGGGETRLWDTGYYGHTSYHSSWPGQFNGTEYYLQVRVKMDPRRIQGDQPGGGKLFYFTRTDRSNTSQEIVTNSGVKYDGKNILRVYRSGGGAIYNDDPGDNKQPNSELGHCEYPQQTNNCWAWSGGWDTILYHVVPGLHGNNDTVFQVWAAHPGETSYVKIWDQDNVDLPFDVVNGHNAVICSGYMNGKDFTTDFYHRYCQMIFSHNFIPCPQV